MIKRRRRKSEDFAVWFWSKANKTQHCWYWTLTRFRLGYGSVSYQGKIQSAHRVAYKLVHGEIPAGMDVLHSCDNRACVNPEHLSLGDHKKNMRDKMERGRHVVLSGEENGNVRLTWVKVRRIRRLRDTGLTYRELAAQFKVDFTTIAQIVTRKTWRE